MTENKHLDLGSGRFPRNPFGASKLFGIDIVEHTNLDENIVVKKADLNLEPLPFDDCEFSSVSAFDFLEHIARVDLSNGQTQFPFMRLMSEIHRVLIPGGKFLALTPVYPKESAFVDPTHVNFLTKNTHKYFCSPDLWASMYGYEGDFEVEEVKIVKFSTAMKKLNGQSYGRSLLLDAIFPLRKQHVLWKIVAKK